MFDGLVELIIYCSVTVATRRSHGRRSTTRANYGGRWCGNGCRSRSWRLVGECARHTTGRHACATIAITGLLTADCGFLRSGVRLVGFRGLLSLRKIEIGRHLGAHITLTYNRSHDRLDAVYKTRFDLIEIFELSRIESRFIAPHIGRDQQITALIDYGNILRRQIGHAGRNQMHDAADLRWIQVFTAAQIEKHRG